jgi:hypothetical protein
MAENMFKFQWPQIQNLISLGAINTILKLKSENSIVSLSEQIDGSNLCISTANWVASRKVTIVPDILAAKNNASFCRYSLFSLKQILPKINGIKKELKKFFNDSMHFDILLYGEWIQKGTASSIIDQFHYNSRQIKVGHFYAFGLGIEFKQKLTNPEKLHAENVFLKLGLFYQQMTSTCDTSKSVFQFFLNLPLFGIFKQFNIFTVPFLGNYKFLDLINDDFFIEILTQQQCKGLILVAQNTEMLKWKPDSTRNKTLFETVNNSVFEPIEKQFSRGLAKVFFNYAAAAPSNKKTIPKLITIYHIFFSAKSKFPPMTDLLKQEFNVANWKKIKKIYQMCIVDEMEKDVQKIYSGVMDIDITEIENFAKSMILNEWKEMDENMLNFDLSDEEINHFFRSNSI